MLRNIKAYFWVVAMLTNGWLTTGSSEEPLSNIYPCVIHRQSEPLIELTLFSSLLMCLLVEHLCQPFLFFSPGSFSLLSLALSHPSIYLCEHCPSRGLLGFLCHQPGESFRRTLTSLPRRKDPLALLDYVYTCTFLHLSQSSRDFAPLEADFKGARRDPLRQQNFFLSRRRSSRRKLRGLSNSKNYAGKCGFHFFATWKGLLA